MPSSSSLSSYASDRFSRHSIVLISWSIVSVRRGGLFYRLFSKTAYQRNAAVHNSYTWAHSLAVRRPTANYVIIITEYNRGASLRVGANDSRLSSDHRKCGRCQRCSGETQQRVPPSSLVGRTCKRLICAVSHARACTRSRFASH